MAENQPPASSAADVPGLPFYERTRKHLRDLLAKKRILDNQLAATEESIHTKETEYLEETPHGNIIVGFENYTKNVGTAGGVGGRGRRGFGVGEGNRVFSRSSISFRVGEESPANTAHSTPLAAMSATPLSASFVKGDGSSNHATPTSASSASRNGQGAGKKNKKPAEEEEDDGREPKKVRTNFGAVKK